MIGALNKQKIKEAFNFSFGKTPSDLIKEKKRGITKDMFFIGAITALNVFLTVFLMKYYEGDVIIFGEYTSTLLFLLEVMNILVLGRMLHKYFKIQELSNYKSDPVTHWNIVIVLLFSLLIPAKFTPKPASGCFSYGTYYTVEIGENYKAKIAAEQERNKKISDARLNEFKDNNQEIRPLQSIQ